MPLTRDEQRRQQRHEDISRLLKTNTTNAEYSKYQNDFAAFFRDQLAVNLLTDGQLQIIHAVHTYPTTVVTSATGTGKTWLLAGLAVAIFKSFDEVGVYISAASPEPNLRTLSWGEITKLMARAPHLFTDTISTDLTISKTHLVRGKPRPSMSRIMGIPIPSQGRDAKMETAFSGKHHAHAQARLYDEADGIPEPCYVGADGCLSGTGWQRSVLFLNPKSRDGRPYDLIESGRAHHIVLSAFDHPNVITGQSIIHGAVSQEITVHRINAWTSMLNHSEVPDENCFQVPDFLVGKQAVNEKGELWPPLEPGWRRVDNDQFWYKVLGVYPPVSAGYLINPIRVAEAVVRWQMYRQQFGGPPPGVFPRMLFDPADDPGGDASSVVLRYGDFVDLPIRLIGTDARDYAHKAADLYHSRSATSCFVDSIGVGAAVPHIMARDRGCTGVIGFKSNRKAPWSLEGKFDTQRDYCLYMMAQWINNVNSTAMIPDDDRLIKSLKALKATTTDSIRVISKKQLRQILGFSPDSMDALAMSFAQPTFFGGGI